MRNNSLHQASFEQLKSLFLRGIVVFSLATMLAVTVEMSRDVTTVAAAGNSATTLHQDRRPDRERAVGTIRSRLRTVRR